MSTELKFYQQGVKMKQINELIQTINKFINMTIKNKEVLAFNQIKEIKKLG